jgi:hypothetical protein
MALGHPFQLKALVRQFLSMALVHQFQSMALERQMQLTVSAWMSSDLPQVSLLPAQSLEKKFPSMG